MDGRGRWMDNVFIERLWRSLKYECVFLNAFGAGSEAPQRDRFLDGLLQPETPALDLRRQDTPRGLCYGGNDGATGGIETNPIRLNREIAVRNREARP